MRDCSNGEVRDRLPELMHNRLSGEALVIVRAHVADCADCRAELALLEQLRAAAVAPRIDASRVVAGLPRYRAVPAWRRMAGSAQLRAAAAVLLLIGGYTVLRNAPQRPAQPVVQVETPATAELAIGESFEGLSDSDLAAMVDAIGDLEAVTPEPVEEPLLPLSETSVDGGGA